MDSAQLKMKGMSIDKQRYRFSFGAMISGEGTMLVHVLVFGS